MVQPVNYENAYNELLRVVSHDLNGPLRHIRAFTDLLVDKAKDRLTEREQEYTTYLLASVAEAEDVVDALLTLSRLSTSGEETSRFSLSEVIEDISVECAHTPHIELSGDLVLNGRRQQIRSMFLALIDNACKFNDQASPVQVRFLAEQTVTGARIQVQDNGAGIPDSMHEKVFTIFKQGVSNTSGIGFGLALCHRVCQLHGGSIEVGHSEPGHTVFEIQLPVDH